MGRSTSDSDREARLSTWWRHARDLWRDARNEMAVDDDYVDSIQFDEETLAALQERGQPAISYNEIAAGVHWLTGTERRTRMDWRVLPREEGDTQGAKVKTDCLKYIEDITNASAHRSRAFEQAVRVGMGWLETGVRRSPLGGEDIYYRAEDWRNVWLDPASRAHDVNDDARFLFRSRLLDLDVAIEAWPSGKAALDSDAFVLGSNDDLYDDVLTEYGSNSSAMPLDTGDATGQRQVVRVVECWYRVPATVQTITGPGSGSLLGSVFQPSDPLMRAFVEATTADGTVQLVSARRMVMRLATFTHRHAVLLADGPSPYRHQRFPLVPVWGWRRARDGAPYGPPRLARGPQDALNKRMSKAVFHLSVRQTLAEEGVITDLDEFEEQIARPDGIITCIKKGALKDGSIRVDVAPELAVAHVQLAERDAEFVRNTMGVTGEQLARQTNAQSGRAVIARQEQGSIVTADLFDNLRLAMQRSGELVLSLIEQYWTEPKTVRITGERQQAFRRINQPQPDGTYSDDVTAAKADFIVSAQDWRASLRIAGAEQFREMMSTLPADLQIKLLDLVVEMMDLPMADELVKRIRQNTGQPDPLDEQSVAQADAVRAQEAARAEQVRQAELRKVNAEAAQKEATGQQALAQAQKIIIDALGPALQLALAAMQTPPLAAAADTIVNNAHPTPPPAAQVAP